MRLGPKSQIASIVKQVNTVIIGGLATDYCVKNTTLQLLAAGFRVILNLALDIVIKMVAVNGQPVIKISDSPGKVVAHDVHHLAWEKKLFQI